MYKIMIIDDNHISVDGICHNIDWSDLNAEVACKAYDGQQALDYLQNNMVDLIISDIEMPQLDGLSLAQNALKINSSIKIILISAFDKFEYAKQAIRLGAFDYIEKPLDYSYLKKIIRNALSMLNKEQRNLEILKQSRPIMIDNFFHKLIQTSVYKGYKRDKIEMRGDRAEISDFPLYLNTVAGGLDRRDQTIGGFSSVVKIYAVPVVEIIGQLLYLLGRYGFNTQFGDCL